MIYIDPPYNTGKDFVYRDNFKATPEDYDEDTDYKDAEGNIQFKKNEKTNGRYHSDWLSMMYPRLKLARNLLADDGVIFVSIDDNEMHNLRKLMDEIFGAENFVSQFIWKSRQNKDNRTLTGASIDHEYIICYSKSSEARALSGSERKEESYTNPDNDPRGDWASANMVGLLPESLRPNLHFDLINPETNINYGRPRMGWRNDQKGMNRLIADKRIIWPKDPNGRPRRKVFLSELNASLAGYSSVIAEDVYTRTGTAEIAELFGDDRIFDFPKPSALIKELLAQATGEAQDAIVLDFFAGSATTAHAVIELNAIDNGNRRWIMVQLPEETDEKSEAYKVGYATIPEISRERIRRAGDKIAAEYPDAEVDYGFRALTIADTNYKDVYKPAGQLQQGDLLASVDNVKEDRSDLDLLYGVLTQSALELNRPIKTVEVAGATTYQYDYFGEVSGLIACFAKDVPEEAIKAIAALRPLTAVFRDSSFADSQAKVNLSEHFRILSPETKVKVI
jgi:adenine-specific DNA-methyltransferase